MEKSKGSWEVDLTVWRFGSVLHEHGRLPREDILLDRVRVYPDRPSPPPKITISKQDLETVNRERSPRLCEDEIEIDFAFVYKSAKEAVNAAISDNQNIPSSPVNSDQLSPESPLNIGSSHSYRVSTQSESKSSLGSTGHSHNEADMKIEATAPSSSSQVQLPARRTNNKRTREEEEQEESGEEKEGGDRSGSDEPERSRKRPRPS